MSISDVVKSVVLGGALMSRCGGGEPPEPPPPVMDASPAPQDAYTPPEASAPIDAGAPDVATVPDAVAALDLATVPDVATPLDGVSAPDLIPPPPLPPAKPVNVLVDAEHSYFLYAFAGGAGCNTSAGPPYLVEITSGSTVCVPESAGKLVSLPLDQIRTCNGDTGCVECGSDPGCQPATCFAPLPPAAPGAACSHTLRPIAGAQVTRYMLFPQKPEDTGGPESTGEEEEEPVVKQGLPKILTVADPLEITITPPPEHATFVMGRFDKPVNVTPSGGECGDNSLCTILPLTFTPFGPGTLWDFWGPTTFWAWSLF